VLYPIDIAQLPNAIEFADCDSQALWHEGELLAFGQLVPKPGGRLHLARLIVAPDKRGRGWGRQLAELLIARALDASPSCLSLNVAADNETALRLYRVLGCEEAPRPPDEKHSRARYLVRGPDL